MKKSKLVILALAPMIMSAMASCSKIKQVIVGNASYEQAVEFVKNFTSYEESGIVKYTDLNINVKSTEINGVFYSSEDTYKFNNKIGDQPTATLRLINQFGVCDVLGLYTHGKGLRSTLNYVFNRYIDEETLDSFMKLVDVIKTQYPDKRVITPYANIDSDILTIGATVEDLSLLTKWVKSQSESENPGILSYFPVLGDGEFVFKVSLNKRGIATKFDFDFTSNNIEVNIPNFFGTKEADDPQPAHPGNLLMDILNGGSKGGSESEYLMYYAGKIDGGFTVTSTPVNYKENEIYNINFGEISDSKVLESITYSTRAWLKDEITSDNLYGMRSCLVNEMGLDVEGIEAFKTLYETLGNYYTSLLPGFGTMFVIDQSGSSQKITDKDQVKVFYKNSLCSLEKVTKTVGSTTTSLATVQISSDDPNLIYVCVHDDFRNAIGSDFTIYLDHSNL